MVVAAGVMVVSLLTVSPGVAAAAPPGYTWSGTDAAAATNSNWSDLGNWKGGAAPASGTTVKLNFPSLHCGTSSCGNAGANDLTGLNVKDFNLTMATQNSGPAYDLTGNGIKLSALDIKSDTPTGLNGQGANILVPLAQQGSEQWSIDAEDGSNVNLGAVTGKSANSLTIDLPVANGDNGGGFVGIPSFETGPLTFQGFVGDNSSYVTGATSYNAKTLQPVSFDQTALFETGPSGTTAKEVTVKYAPLTISDSTVFFGNGYGGPYGIDSVAGDVSLDSGTTLNYNALDPGSAKKPAAGLSYPQLKATGNVNLGSATLGLFATCSQKLGATYTLVSGGAVTGTFQNISSGTIVQANGDSSSTCSTGSPPYLRIDYGTTTVTATVVPPPPASATGFAGRSETAPLVPHLASGHVQMVREGR